MNATTTPSRDSARVPGVPRLLVNRDFALLWAGQAVSNLGDWLFNTTLALWIAIGLGHGKPWAPLAVSGVLVARAVPAILAGPLAGVFVDRWDKRRTLLEADFLRAVLLLLLVPVAGGGLASLPVGWTLGLVYAAVVLTTFCGSLFDPARLALVGDIVAEPDRPRASSLEQLTGSLALVIGPALAAPLYAGLGARWAILADALSFAASFALILRLRPRPPHGPSVVAEVANGPREKSRAGAELVAGLRLIARDRVLRTLVVAGSLAMLGFGAIDALDVFFATETLRAPAAVYGLLQAALGIGLVAGAVLGGALAGRLGLGRVLWLSLVALGLLAVAYARLTSVGPAILTLFLIGIPNGTLNVVAGPLLLRATPRAFVGRVEAALVSALSVASLASIAGAGLLAGTVLRGFHARLLGITLGPVDTIFSATGLLCIVGGLYAMASLRHAPATRQAEDEAA